VTFVVMLFFFKLSILIGHASFSLISGSGEDLKTELSLLFQKVFVLIHI
jgi:hypothetical protein